MGPKLARRESEPRRDPRVCAIRTGDRDRRYDPVPELPRLVFELPGTIDRHRPTRRHPRAWFLLISICCLGLAFALLGVAVCLA